MDNPETLATLDIQDTGQRQSRDTGNIRHTRHRTKTNKTQNTTQKTEKMSNTDPHQKTEVKTQVIMNAKQFLLLIRHLQCYSNR